jgi:hypothetical protein
MRTVKKLWFDKLKSSRLDPLYNLLNGNFLVFKMCQVSRVFLFWLVKG